MNETAEAVEVTDVANVTETPETGIEQAPEPALEQDQNPEQGQEQAPEEGAEPEAPKVDDPWPKKAQNAMARRDKTIAKMRAAQTERDREFQAMRAELDALKSPPQEAPKETDFETYGEYLQALAIHAGQNGNQQQQDQNQEQPKTQEEIEADVRQQIHVEKREKAITAQAEQYIAEVSDFEQVTQENIDIVENFSPELIMTMLEAEDAPLAFYALAKEGKLEDIANMTPVQAAREIAFAEGRGRDMIAAMQKPTVSEAPQPIAGAQAASSGSKSLAEKTADEIDAWVDADS